MQVTLVMTSVVAFQYKEFQSAYPRLWDTLLDQYTHENPEYRKAERYGYSTLGLDPVIVTYEIRGKWIMFGRGSAHRIARFLKSNGIEVVLSDKRLTLPPVQYPPHGIVPYPEQVAFIDDLLKKQQGIGIGDTSFGKTFSVILLAIKTRQPLTVIVHTEFLAKQWIKAFTLPEPNGFHFPMSMIGGCGGPFLGKTRVRILNVCLYHSLQDKENLKLFIPATGIVVVDETQKAAIEAVQNCIKYFTAKYRFGVTAEVKRKDRKECLVLDTIGDVVHVALSKDSDSKIKSRITIIETDYKDVEYDWDRNYTGLIGRMSLDPERNTLILRRCMRQVANKKQVIIFVERKAQAFVLASALIKKNIRVGLLIGQADKAMVKGLSGMAKKLAENYKHKTAYEHIMKLAPKRELDVIIATQKGEVGLSVRTLNHAIITTPVAKTMEDVKDRFNQIIGRVERTHGAELEALFGIKDTPTVDVIVDSNIANFKNQIKNIKSFYGNRVTVVKRKENT